MGCTLLERSREEWGWESCIKWPLGRTLKGISQNRGHKDMNEHGKLQHLIQSKGQHRVFNGPPNHMRLTGSAYRWKHNCPPDSAPSGSPSSPHRPLRKVCHDLRNLSFTCGNCINPSYLHRSPISKHLVLIFNPENTSFRGQQVSKAQRYTIVWEVKLTFLCHNMLLPNSKVRSRLFLVKLQNFISSKTQCFTCMARKSKYTKLLG